MDTDTTATDTTATTAPCPKCGAAMDLTAIVPHPLNNDMERHTFLCAKCNHAETYMLPASAAADLAEF
jgi:C4-type Zn-finger protein